ncbi:MAG TPA: Nif3-like dinuclear metal center hexameric protein, partial [Terrimicrobiaceae bacterium]|nr:Nif3-like dinuclear metal center hexameric protein [Terrimicrobiaceae bacterium]
PNALNGLQVGNGGEVTRVAAAVDACESVVQAAVDAGADLLIVHHGLFWSGLSAVTGSFRRKLKTALDANLAVYSAHLPLDAHPDVGNNVLLGRALGLGEVSPFLKIGVQGNLAISRSELRARLAGAVGGPVHLAPGGPEMVRRIGIVTGGAGGDIFQAAAEGVDAFITGEGPHWSYTAAEESGMNLFYAGHYATETFGVRALAGHIEQTFGLPWSFLDHPTGL